jgi:hypothetical protein
LFFLLIKIKSFFLCFRLILSIKKKENVKKERESAVIFSLFIFRAVKRNLFHLQMMEKFQNLRKKFGQKREKIEQHIKLRGGLLE